MKPAIKILQNIPQFPIASDQLAMLLEGNVCDPEEWAEVFDIDPEDFADGLKKCL
jgi:NADH dehydrogenase